MFSLERPCGKKHAEKENAYSREELEEIAKNFDVSIYQKQKKKSVDKLCNDVKKASLQYIPKEIPPPLEFREYKTDVKVPKHLFVNRQFNIKRGVSKYIQDGIGFTEERLLTNELWNIFLYTPYKNSEITTYFHRKETDDIRTNNNLFNICHGKLQYNYLYNDLFKNFSAGSHDIENRRIMVVVPSNQHKFLRISRKTKNTKETHMLPFDSSQLLGYVIFEIKDKSVYIETICTRGEYMSRLEYTESKKKPTIYTGLGKLLLQQVEQYSLQKNSQIKCIELEAVYTALHAYVKLNFIPYGDFIRSYISRPPRDQSEKIKESLEYLQIVGFRQRFGKIHSKNVVICLYWIIQDILSHHYKRFENVKTIYMYRPISTLT